MEANVPLPRRRSDPSAARRRDTAQSGRRKGKYNTARAGWCGDARLKREETSRTCEGHQPTRETQQMTRKRKAGADARAVDWFHHAGGGDAAPLPTAYSLHSTRGNQWGPADLWAPPGNRQCEKQRWSKTTRGVGGEWVHVMPGCLRIHCALCMCTIVSTVDCIGMNASDRNFIFNYGDS